MRRARDQATSTPSASTTVSTSCDGATGLGQRAGDAERGHGHRAEQLEGDPGQLEAPRPRDGTRPPGPPGRPPVRRAGPSATTGPGPGRWAPAARPSGTNSAGVAGCGGRGGHGIDATGPPPAVPTSPGLSGRLGSGAPTIGRHTDRRRPAIGRRGPPPSREKPWEQARQRSTSTRSADDVWAVVGDFGGIGGWMPGIESCRVEGENRILETMGMTITERLVSKDDAGRALTYSIADGAPVETHEAVITVSPGRQRQPCHLGGRGHAG